MPLSVAEARLSGRGSVFPATQSGSRTASPPHIPTLDGLRAVSFLIVFVAHAGLEWIVPGGFGVTVFFYLSGYLITTLMRWERQTSEAVSIPRFYLRRAFRILPPFYLVLLIAIALTLVSVLPGELDPRVLLAQSLHYSNYWFIWHGAAGSPGGTVPYWSLAVEEHFYLLFPLLYVSLSRFMSNRDQARVFWTLCGVVCVWRCVLVLGLGADENRTYMASDTRFDSILFGSALALGLNPVLDRPWGSERLWKSVLLPASIVVLFMTFVYREPWFRETIRYTLQGIALTPIFVTAIRFSTWLPFRFLNARPVAFVGVLSYSLYLIHQVALYGTEYHMPALHPVHRAMLALAISLAVALAIHGLVERPCTRLRNRLLRGPTLVPVAVWRGQGLLK
jgi:peptidoglycan/LPS O-acetylase OafA/YrhL